MDETTFPVYEFRPLLTDFRPGYEVFRFAEGQWIPDDGEYDLAFASHTTCLYVQLPYHKNIRWSWVDHHWSATEVRHPRGNAWHYMLADGETEWGGDWARHAHANEKASRDGMRWVCSQYRVANGASVSFQIGEPHIAAGLVRDHATKAVLTFPETLCCMHCGIVPPLTHLFSGART